MNSPIAWTILAILAIVSFIYAIVCQHKNKEKKELSFARKSHVLIQNSKEKFDKLSILYDGETIDNLCVSKYSIWNSGNKTLDCSDIVTTKELTISVKEESKILEASILSVTEETNNFTYEKVDEHTIKVTFDYIDKKDGVVIQVIHTGKTEDLEISCKIKGGKELKTHSLESNKKHATSRKLVSIVSLIGSFFITVVSSIGIFVDVLIKNGFISDEQYIANFYNNDPSMNIYSVWVTFVLYATTFALSIYLTKMAYHIGIPTKLKKNFDADIN